MTQYAVVKGGSCWDLYENGERIERHADRLEAVESAYALALAVQAQGRQTELLVQDEGGELETWTLASWSGLRRSKPTAALA